MLVKRSFVFLHQVGLGCVRKESFMSKTNKPRQEVAFDEAYYINRILCAGFVGFLLVGVLIALVLLVFLDTASSFRAVSWPSLGLCGSLFAFAWARPKLIFWMRHPSIRSRPIKPTNWAKPFLLSAVILILIHW